jgi:hypothetical protein
VTLAVGDQRERQHHPDHGRDRREHERAARGAKTMKTGAMPSSSATLMKR